MRRPCIDYEEGIRQRVDRDDDDDDDEAPRNTRKHYQHHSELLRRIDMQRDALKSTHIRPLCAYWCETRLSTIGFPVLLCDRLDYETIHVTKQRNGIRSTSQSQLDDLDFADE